MALPEEECGLCLNRIDKYFDIQTDIGDGLLIRDIVLQHYWFQVTFNPLIE